MLTKEEYEEAYENLYNSICELEEIKSGVETTCVFDDSLNCFKELIEEHFDNPQIDWLKNCMGEEAFNLIFSSQEEVNKWLDRMRWHVKKCDEYGRELDILKNNPPLKWEELKEGMFVWDNRFKLYIKIEDISNYGKEKTIQPKSDYFCYPCDVEYRGMCFLFEENRFYRKEVVQE